MRAWQIEGSFGLENLRLVERPDPEPRRGQVVLRMHAASLNFRDSRMIRGQYDARQKLPLVPLSDGCGTVESVGEGVTRVAVGDRVCPIFCQQWLAGEPTRERLRSTLGGPHDGTLAEKMVLDAEGVVKVPATLGNVAAATLPCAALTAWSALVTLGGLRAGQTVLVQGTGGVSLFALQIAKALGARVIATSSHDDKLARLRALGADEVLNYRNDPDWGSAARKLTGGVGVDHVVEVAGGASLEQSLRCVRIGGTVSVVGILGGVKSELSLLPVMMQQVRLQGLVVGHRDGFEAMLGALAAWKLEPVVDRVFDLADAPAAIAYLESGQHFGKVVVSLDAAAS